MARSRLPLGQRLFRLVERSQRYAFISDGLDGYSDEEVIVVAERSLKYTIATARKLHDFLDKYESPPQREETR